MNPTMPNIVKLIVATACLLACVAAENICISDTDTYTVKVNLNAGELGE
jgi:hypothetical protein